MYEVIFHDEFDGNNVLIDSFNQLDIAKAFAKSKQAKLSMGNRDMGEHYGVYDSLTGVEVYCLRYK